jgi:hypothetical protein
MGSRAVALGMALLGLAAAGLASQLREGTATGGPGTRFLPVLVAAIVVVLGAALAFRPPAREGAVVLPEPGGSGRARWTLGAIVAYALAFGRLGFVLATALLLTVLLRAYGERRWPVVLAVALGATGVAYALFAVWFGVRSLRVPSAGDARPRAPVTDLFRHLALGFGVALTPVNLLYCFVGVVVGTAIGVLPGIGPVTTVAMLVPLTFGMSPTAALIMLGLRAPALRLSGRPDRAGAHPGADARDALSPGADPLAGGLRHLRPAPDRGRAPGRRGRLPPRAPAGLGLAPPARRGAGGGVGRDRAGSSAAIESPASPGVSGLNRP